MTRWRQYVSAAAVLFTVEALAPFTGRGPAPVVLSQGRPPGASASVVFTDVTRQAGITFRHNSGAFGRKYLPETMGAGCAFLDYDNDGWQDLFLVNSSNWPGRPTTRSLSALYRNNRDGTFTDITDRMGLAVTMYGMGVAAADYDNDGWIDILVTGLGDSRLFRNHKGERFVDV
ncbi:MAG: FG-GAP repeat domain-containing protein, partial [Acidobacteriota bacterium]